MSCQIVPIHLSISNAYLLKGRRNVLVDTGSPGDFARLLAALHDHDVAPRDLALILHTHGHGDHAGSTAELRAVTTAPVAVHLADSKMLCLGKVDRLRAVRARHWLLRPLIHFSYEPVEPDLMLEDGMSLAEFGVDGRVVATPGHSRGSVTVALDDGAVIAGDLLRGGYLNGLVFPSRPLHPYFADDLSLIGASVQRLLDMGCHTFHIGHGGPLTRQAVADWQARFTAR